MSSDKITEILEKLVAAASSNPTVGFKRLSDIAGLDYTRDFRGAYLREIDFRDEDLSGFDFTGADLSGADFRRANVIGMVIANATLDGAIGLENYDNGGIPADLDYQSAKKLIANGRTLKDSWRPFIMELRLGSSGIRSLDGLEGLSELRHLSLKGTIIHDLTILEQLTKLESIYLDNSRCRSLEPLSNLVNLKRVEAFNCRAIDSIDCLRNLTNLVLLDVSHTSVNNIAVLELMLNLEYLYVSGTPVTDVSSVSSLPKLRSLFARNNVLSADQFSHGFRKLQNLTVGQIIGDLSFLERMLEMHAFECEISDCEQFPDLSELEFLSDLSINFSNTVNLDELKHVENLRVLRLGARNKASLPRLKPMRRLRDLQFRGISTFNLSDFKGSRFLSTVSVTDCDEELNIETDNEFSYLRRISLINCKSPLFSNHLEKFKGLNYINFTGSEMDSFDFILKNKSIHGITDANGEFYPRAVMLEFLKGKKLQKHYGEPALKPDIPHL